MTGNIQVKPTELLHGEVYLTNHIVIQPKRDWVVLPLSPDPPSNPAKLQEWQEIMQKIDHYYAAGKLAVNFKTPKFKKMKRDKFWCADLDRNHPGERHPAVNGELCQHCINKRFEEQRKKLEASYQR
ncbi:MAG: hypothetical protein PHN44_10870 [Candidatus Marinimicrobia bacterium]|jgi:hypothetical protein|nr:hypothetical protein [Candidatus Neomarinimicrobiota bacterium]MDD5539329.1 hypothetical protein [Candidatus Neomarinimicrobiota bacterium]